MSKIEEKIVKFEGGTNIFWRHPVDNVDENTVIICPHTHEVVYIKDGAMLDSLKSGSHRIVEKEAKKSLFNKKIPQYSCDILFVNVNSTLKILWGTPSRIELFDPKINIPVSVGLNGSFLVRIENARKFISKLGGLDTKFTTDSLQDFFRGMMLLYIKDSMAKAMIVEKISFYELWSNMRTISDSIRKDLSSKFLDYGVELCEFIIEHVLIPDETKEMVERIYKEKFELTERGMDYQTIYNDQKEKEAAERELIKETIKAEGDNKSGNFCSQCGQKIEDGDNFCTKCGKKVIEEDKICVKCGFVLSFRSNFCPNCGEKN